MRHVDDRIHEVVMWQINTQQASGFYNKHQVDVKIEWHLGYWFDSLTQEIFAPGNFNPSGLQAQLTAGASEGRPPQQGEQFSKRQGM